MVVFMTRKDLIERIIEDFNGMYDDVLLDELNTIDSELGNEILGDKRLWIMDRDLPDFCTGVDGFEVYEYFASGHDANSYGPFNPNRLYFGGYTFKNGVGSLKGMYSTDQFNYRDFIDEAFAQKVIDNYDILKDYISSSEICEAIESLDSSKDAQIQEAEMPNPDGKRQIYTMVIPHRGGANVADELYDAITSNMGQFNMEYILGEGTYVNEDIVARELGRWMLKHSSEERMDNIYAFCIEDEDGSVDVAYGICGLEIARF